MPWPVNLCSCPQSCFARQVHTLPPCICTKANAAPVARLSRQLQLGALATWVHPSPCLLQGVVLADFKPLNCIVDLTTFTARLIDAGAAIDRSRDPSEWFVKGLTKSWLGPEVLAPFAAQNTVEISARLDHKVCLPAAPQAWHRFTLDSRG
jgi:hypothetical protein